MKRIAFIAIAIVALTTAGLFAQGRGPAPFGGPGGGGPQGDSRALADYLSLTTEQKAAWQSIQSDLHTSMEALHTQERALADQLQTALEGTDATAIGNLMLQIRAIHAQNEAARDAADAKFAALLTTEQKTKFAAFQAAVEFLHQRGPGPGGPGGPH